MRRREMRYLPGSSRRGAYTLLELTVVIFIIVTLMALSAAAVIKFMAVQQGSNTKMILERTQAKLNKAWSAEKDNAYSERYSPMTEPAYIPGTIPPQPAGMTVAQWIQQNLAGNDANAAGRVRVLYVKLRMRRAFPMNFNEALHPAPLPQSAAYVSYLTNLGITSSTGANYESSACLLMALQRAPSGTTVDASDLTAGGAAGNATTPSGGTIPYLTDAWNAPVYFTRVPVGSSALNSNPYPGGGQPGINDPLDPQGYLQTANWAQTYGGFFTLLTLQQLAGPNSSYNQAPMLLSTGMDKTLETDPITFQTMSTSSDDLMSTP